MSRFGSKKGAPLRAVTRSRAGSSEEWAREELNLRPHAYQAREAGAGAPVPVRTHHVWAAQRGLALETYVVRTDGSEELCSDPCD
jgi:hypothetical protein